MYIPNKIILLFNIFFVPLIMVKFVVLNSDGRETNYSSLFKTKELAEKWYNKTGAKLEKMFNRKLIMIDRGDKIN